MEASACHASESPTSETAVAPLPAALRTVTADRCCPVTTTATQDVARISDATTSFFNTRRSSGSVGGGAGGSPAIR